MHISLELSSIQHNSIQSAEIAAAVAEYERGGGVIHKLETTQRVALPFNSETIAYGYKTAGQSERKAQEALALERRTVEQLRTLASLGLKAAAAQIGVSSTRLGHLAKEYGVTFPSKIRPASPLALKREAEALLVPDITRRFAEGANQQTVIREFGLTRERLVRMAKHHCFDLPGAVDEEADRKLIERIKAFSELGVPRTTCAKCMGISQKKLWRIIDMYAVHYPMHQR